MRWRVIGKGTMAVLEYRLYDASAGWDRWEEIKDGDGFRVVGRTMAAGTSEDIPWGGV